MKSTTPKLDRVFSSFSIPLKVTKDNGSPFDCGNFDKCAKYLLISPPHLHIPEQSV